MQYNYKIQKMELVSQQFGEKIKMFQIPVILFVKAIQIKVQIVELSK